MSHSNYLHERSSHEPGFDRDLHITADLNLNAHEQVSLVLALESALREYGVDPDGRGREYAPTSHIGTLVSLARRVRMMRLGIMRWNERDDGRAVAAAGAEVSRG